MITGRMQARILARVLDQNNMLRLFIGTTGPNEDDVEEVTGGGYQPRIIKLTDWTITASSPALAEGPVYEFRFDGSKRVIVVGAFLTEPGGGALWVEPFRPEPIEVGRRGDIIPVRPIMRLGAIS
jgi:hypothetical protein